MTFGRPYALIGLLVIPVLIAATRRTRTQAPTLRLPSLQYLLSVQRTWRTCAMRILPVLRYAAIGLLVVALARPVVPVFHSRVEGEGIDIVLALDVSSSMLAADLSLGDKPVSRFEAARTVVQDFIAERAADRIGVVVFAGRPYTLAPITWDHEWVRLRLDEAEVGMIEDGTAIGSALVAAANRLKDSEAKSKVIILLTDGSNNAGEVPPDTAAAAVAALGVKVYTIGAGAEGTAPYPVVDAFGRTIYTPMTVDIDEELLQRIAEATGGEYFRATDGQSLKQIYHQIDQMERTPMEYDAFIQHRDLYPVLVLIGLALLLLEVILSHTVFRRLP
jgi:Ca-activated chloride channel family protein